MDYKEVERVVKAVASHYGFVKWQSIFSNDNEEAIYVCVEVLCKMPLFTEDSAAEVLGVNVNAYRHFVKKMRVNSDYKFNREHYDKIESIIFSFKQRNYA